MPTILKLPNEEKCYATPRGVTYDLKHAQRYKTRKGARIGRTIWIKKHGEQYLMRNKQFKLVMCFVCY